MLHLEELIRCSLNVLSDLVTMSGSIKKRPQDEHVQGSLENTNPLLCRFCHRRQSTLDLAMIVGIRLSTVKGYRRMWILELVTSARGPHPSPSEVEVVRPGDVADPEDFQIPAGCRS